MFRRFSLVLVVVGLFSSCSSGRSGGVSFDKVPDKFWKAVILYKKGYPALSWKSTLATVFRDQKFKTQISSSGQKVTQKVMRKAFITGNKITLVVSTVMDGKVTAISDYIFVVHGKECYINKIIINDKTSGKKYEIKEQGQKWQFLLILAKYMTK